MEYGDLRPAKDHYRELKLDLRMTQKILIQNIKIYVKTTPLDVLIKRWGRNVKQCYITSLTYNMKEGAYIESQIEYDKKCPTIDFYTVTNVWNKLPKHLQRKLILVYLINKETK